MVDFITNITSSPEPVSTSSVQPSSQNASTAEAAAQTHGTKKDFDTNTQISSLAQLKEKAPEVYQQMMMGLAQSIVKKMHRAEERLKEIKRKARQA